MKVLITGGLGYIGSHTTVEVLKEGHDVVIADNSFEAVAIGTGKALEDTEKLKIYTKKSKRRGQ